MMLHIEAQGKKDREAILSKVLLRRFTCLLSYLQPKEFLFKGQHGGAYSTGSLQLILKRQS
jgi:hypothetical protein